jgi:hypothetical protein
MLAYSAVILIGSDLSKLVETLRIARRCRSITMQTFVGTLVVGSIGVGMAAFGFLNPLLAAFIHITSEMAFILNSTRLLPRSSEIRALSSGTLPGCECRAILAGTLIGQPELLSSDSPCWHQRTSSLVWWLTAQ